MAATHSITKLTKKLEQYEHYCNDVRIWSYSYRFGDGDKMMGLTFWNGEKHHGLEFFLCTDGHSHNIIVKYWYNGTCVYNAGWDHMCGTEGVIRDNYGTEFLIPRFNILEEDTIERTFFYPVQRTEGSITDEEVKAVNKVLSWINDITTISVPNVEWWPTYDGKPRPEIQDPWAKYVVNK
jgi:hypothetical protein